MAEDQSEGRFPLIVTTHVGSRLRLRPIRREDWPALQAGYETWSETQKRWRMLDTVAHLTDRMAQDFSTIRDPAHEICLVLTPEDDDATLLGGARLVGAPEREDGEFSVSIRGDAQGMGLGRIALEAVLAEGPRLGITRAWGLIARRNDAMLGLARKLGFSIRPAPEDWTLLIAEKELA
mgnify:CR=1 FL=1